MGNHLQCHNLMTGESDNPEDAFDGIWIPWMQDLNGTTLTGSGNGCPTAMPPRGENEYVHPLVLPSASDEDSLKSGGILTQYTYASLGFTSWVTIAFMQMSASLLSLRD